jgi:beta-glucosidase
MPRDGAVTAEVDVTNAGPMAGDEIVQLYVHQKVGSVTRPVKELKDFARVRLEPGETRTLQFTIDAAKLACWTAEMKHEVEPGVFDIMIGPSSVELRTVPLTVQA